MQSAQDKLTELDDLKKDPELAGLAREEEEAVKKDGDEALLQIKKMLAPQAANDSRNCILEIRAAVGGNESCLFAAALLRMYFNYITARGWRLEHISHSDGEVGGYKESLSRICGDGSYGRLKFESGAHRVQRVPQTESQGRVHTSVVTIAVLPETLPEDNIVINPNELRIETFAPQAPAASMSTPPIRRCVLSTFQAALSPSVRMSAHNIETAKKQ